jgi:hypothetical protein
VGQAPKTKILVAVIHDNKDRIERVLAGHIARATGERAPEPLHLERRATRG